jgi:hemerythrin superfamily protein
MDAIKLLKSQHKQAEKLLHELVYESPRAARDRKRLFEKVADMLATHASIEERVFYPGVNVGELEELLLEALEMHLAIKRILADLMTCEEDDPTYLAKSNVLRELVLKHQREEEARIFPLVQRAVDADRLDELGREMESVMLELETSSPRGEVPLQTERAATLGGHFQGVIGEER